MNAHYETNSLYPLSAAPRNGYGHPNPRGEYILIDQRAPLNAVKLNPEKPDGFELVGYSDASVFSSAAAAATAGNQIIQSIRSRGQTRDANEYVSN